MKEYVKHLITCKCFLPQFRHLPNAPFHKFIVFSDLDEAGLVEQSLVQCVNCGIVHKIKEVGKTEILKKEDASSILSIDEVKSGLSEGILNKFSGYDLDLHQWQEIAWILENKQWGRSVILTKDSVDGLTQGKYAQILGEGMIKISGFTRAELLAEKT